MDWLRANNAGAIRSQPLSPDLTNALGTFIPDMGLTFEYFSGGQAPRGSGGPRTGSVRHDHGNAADGFFYRGDERLTWENPDHIPILQDVVRRGRDAGLTGFGAGPGYMQPGSMHIGFGAPAVWGDNGSSANAPDWLREAYYDDSPAAPVNALAGAQPGSSSPSMPMGGQGPQRAAMAGMGRNALAMPEFRYSNELDPEDFMTRRRA